MASEKGSIPTITLSDNCMQDKDDFVTSTPEALEQDVIKYDKSGPHHRYIVTKTICLVFTWISLGLIASMTGPTTPDLRDRLGVDMETISLILGFRSLGTPVGCILSGMLCDRYRSWSDLIGSLCVFLLGTCFIAKPHIYNLPFLAIICFLEGYGHGGMDAAGHAMIPWMWHDRAGPPMNAIHLGFPIGSALAPLIAVNFLKPQTESENVTTIAALSTPAYNFNHNEYILNDIESLNSDIFANVTDKSVDWSPTYYYGTTGTIADEEPVSSIQIPYAIAGSLALMMGCFIILVFLYGKVKGISIYGKSKTSFKVAFSPKGFRRTGNTSFTVVILIGVCLFLGFCNGGSAAIDPFIFSFATESDLQFTNEEASILETTYKSVAIFSRVICTIISRWIPSQVILGVSASLYALSSVCLALFGPDKRVYFWVFICLFEFFKYPLWPAAMLWSAEYIKYSSLVVGFVQISSSLMSFFAQWVSGYMYDNFESGTFMLFGMGLLFMMLFVWIIMQTFASCHPSRKPSKDSWKMEAVEYSSNVNLYTQMTRF